MNVDADLNFEGSVSNGSRDAGEDIHRSLCELHLVIDQMERILEYICSECA